MDDTEDDARYPPNPRPPKSRHHVSSSSAHPKAPFRDPPPLSQFGGRYAEPDEEYDEEDEEEQNDMGQPSDNEDEDDEQGGGYHRPRDFGGEEEDSSSESRGKRRRIDKLALGFEFAPRVPPPAAAVAPSKAPARTSPPDWSEESTFILLDAWGDRYLQNGRKSLRSDEWNEVAKLVSQASKVNRSDAQCRNRLDTLKKKYKKEKAAMELGSARSKWVYFKKMDALMSTPSPLPPAGRQKLQQQPPPPPKLPYGVDAGEYVFASSSAYKNHYSGNDEMRDSPGDSGTEDEGDREDHSDGLPPKRVNVSGSSDSSFKMLAESIQKFGEIYEKMENYKRQQMAELERMRKEFQRDLEVQKRQILERAQVEIAKLNDEQVEEDDEDREDREEDNSDGDDGGSAENLSG
ncbi:trihelix transcription factor ASIL2-like isoform X2 [Canna indica]|uniref:Trihelix transcription factor ASIL2-like isoform X2 n=1 Tax=Canna indica TaxID=4628 RepID=A0AAQ3Q7C1_9LILI|nr:trihelix transcription factor ASIL2-like isoform X2 [Canna indica]